MNKKILNEIFLKNNYREKDIFGNSYGIVRYVDMLDLKRYLDRIEIEKQEILKQIAVARALMDEYCVGDDGTYSSAIKGFDIIEKIIRGDDKDE